MHFDLWTCLAERILVGEEYCESSASTQEKLDLESVDVWVMGRLVVVEHQIQGVCGRADEKDLEDCIVGGIGEGPEEILSGLISDEQGNASV